MSKLALIATIVAALGCGNKDKATVQPSAACMEAGHAMARFYTERIAAATSDKERQELTSMGAVASARMAVRCTEDKWSAEASACVASGGKQACEKHLTEDQLKSLRADIEKLQATLPK